MSAIEPPKITKNDFTFIYDNYLSTDEEKGKEFAIIDKFFDSRTYNINNQQITHALNTVELALRQFREISEANKTWLTSCADKISTFRRTFLTDNFRSGIVKKLTGHFISWELIPTLTADLSVLFTPARRIHKCTFSDQHLLHLSAFLVRNYDHIPEKIQIDVRQIHHVVQMEFENPLCQQIKGIFLELVIEKKEGSVPIIPLTPPRPDSISKVGSALKKFKNFLTAPSPDPAPKPPQAQDCHSCRQPSTEKQVLEANLASIYSFLNRFVAEYYNKQVFTHEKSNEIVPLFNERLKDIIPRIGRQIFVQRGRPVSRLEKQLVIDLLKQFNTFLTDYVKGPSPKEMYLILKRRLNIPKEESFDSHQLQLATLKELEGIIEQLLFDPQDRDGLASYEDKLIQMALSAHAINAINRFFEPDILAFIIHRLLTGTTFEDPSNAFTAATFPAHDDIFSNEVGGIITSLTKTFLNFGDAKGATYHIGSFIIGLADSQKKTIGEQILKFLTGITSTECIIEPFRILNLILFDGKKPCLQEFLEKSAEEKKKLADSVRTHLEEKTVPDIIEKLKAQGRASKIVCGWDSAKDFCHKVVERLWALTQDRELILIFSYYMLEAAHLSLKAEGARQSRELHNTPLSTTSYLRASRK